MAKIGDRFKTGEINPVSGDFEWDGYADGTRSPEPTSAEKKIPLSKGERFPLIKSQNQGCYWKLVRFE